MNPILFATLSVLIVRKKIREGTKNINIISILNIIFYVFPTP